MHPSAPVSGEPTTRRRPPSLAWERRARPPPRSRGANGKTAGQIIELLRFYFKRDSPLSRCFSAFAYMHVEASQSYSLITLYICVFIQRPPPASVLFVCQSAKRCIAPPESDTDTGSSPALVTSRCRFLQPATGINFVSGVIFGQWVICFVLRIKVRVWQNLDNKWRS